MNDVERLAAEADRRRSRFWETFAATRRRLTPERLIRKLPVFETVHGPEKPHPIATAAMLIGAWWLLRQTFESKPRSQAKAPRTHKRIAQRIEKENANGKHTATGERHQG